MNYLVTGAAGFIGSNIVQELLTQNEKVIGLDNMSTGKQENIDWLKTHPNAQNFNLIKGDIRNPEDCKIACKNATYICHHAAGISVPESLNNPLKYQDINVKGTKMILNAAINAGIKRITFASSAAVYGETDQTPISETAAKNPLSPYGATKSEGEDLLLNAHKAGQIEVTIFRYFNVFGPNQDPNSPYAAVIPLFLSAAKNNQPLTIFGDGNATRDFISVKDIATANINALKAPVDTTGEIYNIATGTPTTITDLANIIIESTRSSSKITHMPPRKGDISHSTADISKFESQFTTKPTSLAEAFQTSIPKT